RTRAASRRTRTSCDAPTAPPTAPSRPAAIASASTTTSPSWLPPGNRLFVCSALSRPSHKLDRKVSAPRVVHLLRLALLAAAYVVLAKLGLRVATVGNSVTLVWPPSGLALAALLLDSRALWPAVAVGAFIVNATTPGVGLLTAAGISAGNTLEAVVG